MPRRHKKLKVLHQRCVHQFPMWLSGLSIPTIWSCLKQDLVSCLRRLESEIGPSTKSPPQQAHHQTESKLQLLEGPDVAFEIMRKTETSAQVMENDRNWWGFLFRNWCYAEVPQLAQLPMISMLPLPCDLNKLWSSWRKHADFRSNKFEPVKRVRKPCGLFSWNSRLQLKEDPVAARKLQSHLWRISRGPTGEYNVCHHSF